MREMRDRKQFCGPNIWASLDNKETQTRTPKKKKTFSDFCNPYGLLVALILLTLLSIDRRDYISQVNDYLTLRIFLRSNEMVQFRRKKWPPSSAPLFCPFHRFLSLSSLILHETPCIRYSSTIATSCTCLGCVRSEL